MASTDTPPQAQPRGPAPIDLGTAGDFAILAKSGVSTVPDSVIIGNVGISPIARGGIVGFSLVSYPHGKYTTSDQVTGKLYAADYSAPTPSKMTTAVGHMEIAYTDAAGRTSPDHIEYNKGILSGEKLNPGLYKFGTDISISSDCTISGADTDVWIFQIAGDINIAANQKIILSGGALAKNIFWQVAGSTTHGAGSHFEGIILGKTASSFFTDATMNGRVLVQTVVTLQSATVTEPSS